MREMADTMDKIAGGMVRGYAAWSGRAEEEIAALMAAETWFDAQAALEAGLSDCPELAAGGRFIFGIVQRGLLPTLLIKQASTSRAWLFVRFSSLLIRTTVSVQKPLASRPFSFEL